MDNPQIGDLLVCVRSNIDANLCEGRLYRVNHIYPGYAPPRLGVEDPTGEESLTRSGWRFRQNRFELVRRAA